MGAPVEEYKTIGTFMLVSGITNIGFGLVLFMSLLILCVGVLYLPVVLVGIMEVIIGLGILRGQPKPTAFTVAILGMVAGLLSMNFLSVIMQSLSLAWLTKPEVKAYLEVPGPRL